MIGKIKEMYRSISGRPLVLLEMEELSSLSEIEKLIGIEKLSISMKKYRKKRSLDANAYHWVLCGKIAEVLNSSIDDVHYDLMLNYGSHMENADGSKAIISVLPQVIPRKCQVYARKIGEGHVDGKQFDHYLLIKPSHLYDSKEMSELIRGTVSEAQELGIETLTPSELLEMEKAMKDYEEKQKSKGLRHITQGEETAD